MASDGPQGDFFLPADPLRFDGRTYESDKDQDRLAAQIRRVGSVMRDGQWRTLDEIAAVTGDPPASVSARLRDFRKPRFGGYTVERRRRDRGLFEYRLDPQSGSVAASQRRSGEAA